MPEREEGATAPEPVSLVSLGVQASESQPGYTLLRIGGRGDAALDDDEVFMLSRDDLETLQRLIGYRLSELV